MLFTGKHMYYYYTFACKLTKVEESNRDSSDCKENVLNSGRLVPEVVAIKESNRIPCKRTKITGMIKDIPYARYNKFVYNLSGLRPII